MPEQSVGLPAEQLRVLVANTVAVLTGVPERRAEWRGMIEQNLQGAEQAGQAELAAFLRTILALLEGAVRSDV